MKLQDTTVSNARNQIDSLIRNLGDNVHYRSLNKIYKRKRKRETPGTSRTTSSLDERDIPPGLELPYRQLFHLLHGGLIGIEKDHDNGSVGNSTDSVSTSTSDGTDKHNVCALLLGPHGSGKTLVLERCLKELSNCNTATSYSNGNVNVNSQGGGGTTPMENPQQQCNNLRSFRVVRLNGTLFRGRDVLDVVREIVRQLSEHAAQEAFYRMKQQNQRHDEEKSCPSERDSRMDEHDHSNNTHAKDPPSKPISEFNLQLQKTIQKESHLLRMRQTNFNSSLALLNQVLQTARIDSIPILIVLDGLESFIGSSHSSTAAKQGNGSTSTNSFHSSSSGISERQLLLYHLLDRVAGHGSLISMVGITTRLRALTYMEKRVRSRADGTSKTIYFGHAKSYGMLVTMILSKLRPAGNGLDEIDDQDDTDKDEGSNKRMESTAPGSNVQTVLESLRFQLKNILLPSEEEIKRDEESSHIKVYRVFRHNYELGQDMQWFCRIISLSLSFLGMNLQQNCMGTVGKDVSGERESGIKIGNNLVWRSEYLLKALKIQGGTIKVDSTSDALASMTGQNSLSTISASLVNSDNKWQRDGWDKPQHAALLDLSGAQVVVLLAAKRIISRDKQGERNGTGKPLTFQRIQKEYEATFLSQSKATGPDRFEEGILYRSFCRLLECDLLRPAKDHTGGGVIQYNYKSIFSIVGQDHMSLRRLPLHLNLDIDGDVGEALRMNLLDCTTAVRDWGLKIN
jgi:Cdc6-like AAA superfamily ATPase